jgi:hypothetical protein
MKTYGRLIKHRLEEEEYVNLEEQYGFTTGRSCIDHIFTLRQILKKCQEKSKQIGKVFIDIEKAYDSVPRKLLWQALEQAAISEHIIDILKSMYSNKRCQVKGASHLSREFYTSKGLLQGCCISPTLFKIYIDTSLRRWSQKCRTMGLLINQDYHLYNLLFADNQMIITQDTEDAEYMLRKLVEEYMKWGLQINFGKTKYFTLDLGAGIVTETGQIKAINKFKYLGSILEATSATTLEIYKRISEGRRVTGVLNSCLVEQNYPSQSQKTYVPGFSPKYSTIWGKNMYTKHTTGEQITCN